MTSPDSFKKYLSSMISIMEETSPTSKGQKKSEKKNPKVADFIAEFKDLKKPKNFEFNDFEELDKILHKHGNFRLYNIIGSLQKTFWNYDNKINYKSSHRLHPERTYLERTEEVLKVEKFGEGYLDQIILWETKKSSKFKELISIMKKLSLLTDIKAKRLKGGRYEMLVKTKNKGVLTSLSDVGFGISQFLPIIVADLQLSKDSSLLVAQPEIHLHPSVQSLFGEYVTSQIKETQKNYIIETHSEYFINRIRLAIAKGELKETDHAIYYIDNKNNDAKIHKIKFSKNGQIQNAPEDFFKTYMMDVMELALMAE